MWFTKSKFILLLFIEDNSFDQLSCDLVTCFLDATVKAW